MLWSPPLDEEGYGGAMRSDTGITALMPPSSSRVTMRFNLRYILFTVRRSDECAYQSEILERIAAPRDLRFWEEAADAFEFRLFLRHRAHQTQVSRLSE
jgi:hypothetical protein